MVVIVIAIVMKNDSYFKRLNKKCAKSKNKKGMKNLFKSKRNEDKN